MIDQKESFQSSFLKNENFQFSSDLGLKFIKWIEICVNIRKFTKGIEISVNIWHFTKWIEIGVDIQNITKMIEISVSIGKFTKWIEISLIIRIVRIEISLTIRNTV